MDLRLTASPTKTMHAKKSNNVHIPDSDGMEAKEYLKSIVTCQPIAALRNSFLGTGR
jgi:hypothetical protein